MDGWVGASMHGWSRGPEEGKTARPAGPQTKRTWTSKELRVTLVLGTEPRALLVSAGGKNSPSASSVRTDVKIPPLHGGTQRAPTQPITVFQVWKRLATQRGGRVGTHPGGACQGAAGSSGPAERVRPGNKVPGKPGRRPCASPPALCAALGRSDQSGCRWKAFLPRAWVSVRPPALSSQCDTSSCVDAVPRLLLFPHTAWASARKPAAGPAVPRTVPGLLTGTARAHCLLADPAPTLRRRRGSVRRRPAFYFPLLQTPAAPPFSAQSWHAL
ncbi:PREDICTED: uncharacterized protein LOC102012891 [Chinchilla lanigera]|uniref:uncharacterized protein LOC102012891 n=1 Tax=Chinchilla lanigera TaxID=34839 RepID=UPI0006967494|nr:PREDICTED: uncharacterized protein LOC102012891 [Chinchilla lanigera]